MRVVLREQRVRLRLTQRLEDIRRIRPMINIHGIAPQRLGHIPRITHKPAPITIHKAPAFPRVIRRLAAHDDFGALGDELLARLGEVVRERVDGNGLAVVCRFARLCTGTRTDGTAVIAATEATAVVVSEFHDDDIVGLYEVDNLVEAAFDGVGARTAAANGFVDDGQGERVGEEDAPAWFGGC
jgi:hypothetical protein